MPKGSAASVSAATVAGVIASLDLHLAAPLAFGIIGVILARIVFVERENRKLHRAQAIRETLPLTLVAALIEVAIVVEFDLNLPKAIFAGLGSGWVAIAFLDVIGDRVLGLFTASRVRINDASAFEHTPESMRDLTRLIDRQDRNSDS